MPPRVLPEVEAWSTSSMSHESVDSMLSPKLPEILRTY
jgi:hypothetical protein